MNGARIKFEIVDSPRRVMKISDAAPCDYGVRLKNIVKRAEHELNMTEEKLNGIILELAPYKFANALVPFWAPRCEPRELKGQINQNHAMKETMNIKTPENCMWWQGPLLKKAFDDGEYTLTTSGSVFTHTVYGVRTLGKFMSASKIRRYFEICGKFVDDFVAGGVDDVILADRESFRAWAFELQRMCRVRDEFMKEIDIETRKERTRRNLI